MTKAQVIEFFGGVAAVAKALNITTQAVYDWGESIPKGRQWQIHVLTEGQLKVSDTNKQTTAA